MLLQGTILIIVIIIILFFCLLRLRHTLPLFSSRPPPRRRGTPVRILIVLGSGGHTAEMLSLLRDLDTTSYTHRSYVISSGDTFSASKALDFESELQAKAMSKKINHGSYDVTFVPRARKIHQSLLTAPFSSFHCFTACISVLRSPSSATTLPSSSQSLTYPHLILANGPATATILILASILLRYLGFPGCQGMMRIIYVESWARVRKMSLSGRLLVGMGACERVLVQWEGLGGRGWGRGEFRGVLVE